MRLRVSQRSSLECLIEAMRTDNSYTQDIWHLQYHWEKLPLFVWGNEKTGFSESFKLRGVPLFGRGHTNSMGMILRHGDEPVMIPSHGVPAKPGGTIARVEGELYLVTPEQLYDFDAKYEAGIYCRRVKRMVTYYDYNSFGKTSKLFQQASCWMFEGIPNIWYKRIKEGEATAIGLKYPNQAAPYTSWTSSDDEDHRKAIEDVRRSTKAYQDNAK